MHELVQSRFKCSFFLSLSISFPPFNTHKAALISVLMNFSQLLDMKLTMEGLEKERDFYFGKLRDIELICQEQENENNPVLTKIMDTLYATEVSTVRSLMHRKFTLLKFISVLLCL